MQPVVPELIWLIVIANKSVGHSQEHPGHSLFVSVADKNNKKNIHFICIRTHSVYMYRININISRCLGEDIWLHRVWESLQAFVHPFHPSAHTFQHQALSLPVLWQELSPEVRHEEAHLHTYRWVPLDGFEFFKKKHFLSHFTSS